MFGFLSSQPGEFGFLSSQPGEIGIKFKAGNYASPLGIFLWSKAIRVIWTTRKLMAELKVNILLICNSQIKEKNF